MNEIHTVVWWQNDEGMCYRTLANYIDAVEAVDQVLWFQDLDEQDSAYGLETSGVEFVAFITTGGTVIDANRIRAVVNNQMPMGRKEVQ